MNELRNGAAAALIWSRVDDTVLTILRSELGTMPLQWCLPGGHVEQGEDHESAILRECMEEIGTDLSDRPRVLLSRRTSQEPVFIHHDYAIAVPRQFKPKLNWEHVDHKWTSLSELPEPMAWPLQMLLSNDRAADRLKRFQDTIRKSMS